jgi:hypothetical protein
MALTNVTIAFDKIYFEPMLDISKEIESGLPNNKAASILTRIDSLQHNCSIYEANVYIIQNLTKATATPASPEKPAK